jgi:hypothetical protein
MKKTFTGTDVEVGFMSAWEVNKEITSELHFFKPCKSVSYTYVRVSNGGSETKVAWGLVIKINSQ